jgi:transglutaminase-like putative cysteine protease
VNDLARRRQRMAVVDEVALALVTLAAVVGMHRLFLDGSYRGPLVAQALLAHLTVTLLRRARVRLLPAAVVTAVVAVFAITWARFPDTAHLLLPTGGTFRQAVDDLNEAWRLFGKVRAPAPVANGFLAATSAAIWAIAFVADWGAFRVGATFEAILPATTLFVFAAALGGTGNPIAAAALFAAAALLFVLLHRTSNQERTSRWSDAAHGQGRWSLLGTGATLSALAVVVGVVAGVTVAGAGADALFPWRDLNRTRPPRIVPSPMVSLQTQLVDQPNVELFTVNSSEPSYWRLTSLDTFDGKIWRQSYTTGRAKGRLPQQITGAAKVDKVRQRFEIRQLSSVWLPAAATPVAVRTADDQPADYDKPSSTLMVDRNMTSSNGYSYTVESDLPKFSADQLQGASNAVPRDVETRYEELPAIPQDVQALAEQVTGRATTQYGKALALQDFLRSDQFTYDLKVGKGHSNNALHRFLFETRRGYCEQFAGAYAVMARAVHIPTRVAIGFTWGVQDSNHPTTYRVRGTHAHAWPEVYIGQYGWVPMEPTPGRAPPGSASFLGVQPSQADAAGGTDTLPAPTTTAPGQGGQNGNPDANAERQVGEGQDTGDSANGSGGSGDGLTLARAAERVALPLGIALAAYLLLVPTLLASQRAVRRRRAATPSARVALSWQDATDRARHAGLALPAWLTINETAGRLAAELPGSAGQARVLAHSMEMITYAEVAPSPEDVDAAARAAGEVSGEARRSESWWRRLLAPFDARRLWRQRPERLVATQGVGQIR